MFTHLKMVIDPTFWLGAAIAAGAVAGPVVVVPAPDPFFEWTGIPLRVVLGGLLGSLIGQSFLPAATLWRGALAVAGGIGFAAIAEPPLTAALTHYLAWWPRLPFVTGALLGACAPSAVPVLVNGIPTLWARWTSGKNGGGQ